MKKVVVVLLLVAPLCGCGYMKGMEAASNRGKLHKLEIGMTQDAVMEVMGKPYKREAYESQEVWFYITELQADGYTTLDEMTPLVFENGTLIGWGSKFVDENIKKYELRVR